MPRIALRNPRKRDRVRAKSEAAFAERALAQFWPQELKYCSGLTLISGLNICGVQDAAQQKPHSLAPPPSLSRAVSRYLTKVRLSKGLVRKQIAPAFSARARIVSSGKAVMKMNGTLCPCVSNRACRSTPLMPGIWTSAITQDVSLKW